MTDQQVIEFLKFVCDRYYASAPTIRQIELALADFRRKHDSDEW